MEQENDPASKPKDATQATDEQREEQALLDNQGGDPDAPGGHLDRHQKADET